MILQQKATYLLLPSFSLKRRFWPLVVALAYLLTIALLGGLNSKHVIISSCILLDYYNEKTRLFLKYFFPFIFTAIVYDSMRYYYWWGISGNIHVAEPYFLEKKLFGILSQGKLVTPNEFFETNSASILDLFCGFAYLTFIFESLIVALYLLLKDEKKILKIFAWSFFIVNLLGFATYFIYPAAPPWYVSQYGLGAARMDILHASPAATLRFDQILGTQFFSNMYGMSVDVYGAIPSLHVSYPLLVCWVTFQIKKFYIPAIMFYLLMCFSAVYLQHHYVIDIILGTIYALLTLWIVKKRV